MKLTINIASKLDFNARKLVLFVTNNKNNKCKTATTAKNINNVFGVFIIL